MNKYAKMLVLKSIFFRAPFGVLRLNLFRLKLFLNGGLRGLLVVARSLLTRPMAIKGMR